MTIPAEGNGGGGGGLAHSKNYPFCLYLDLKTVTIKTVDSQSQAQMITYDLCFGKPICIRICKELFMPSLFTELDFCKRGGSALAI